MPTTPLLRRLALAACLAAVSGCAGTPAPPSSDAPAPARGVILISLDTLRADHLGAYGYARDTSPRLDALAARGVLFERAFSHAPSTLIAHMSLFTALLPPEHGVRPPVDNVLAASIPTLPEAFAAAGFRTAGHTEGGYMDGDHGFARGFAEWSDPGFTDSTDVLGTFEKGLDFLRRVGPEERFFLFLHTYSIHDPYEPPEAFRHRYWQGPVPTTAPASAATLEASNAGRSPLGAEEARYFASRYDDGIRYADEVLGRFVDQLAALGLLDQVTLMITSDHGEEFLEHGRMLHTQVYPELLHVPLVVLHPGLAPRRVTETVRSIDMAPTLLALAGLPGLPDVRGRSLVPQLRGVSATEAPEPAGYAEVAFIDQQRMLLAEHGGRLLHAVERTPLLDPDGAWIAGSVLTDVDGRRVGLRLAAFHQPRRLRIAAGRELLVDQELAPEWTDLELRLPGERNRLELSVDGCVSPAELGTGTDARCLGFMVAAPVPRTLEVFDLDADAAASRDLSFERADLASWARKAFDALSLQARAAAGRRDPGEEERRALEALGYVSAGGGKKPPEKPIMPPPPADEPKP